MRDSERWVCDLWFGLHGFLLLVELIKESMANRDGEGIEDAQTDEEEYQGDKRNLNE